MMDEEDFWECVNDITGRPDIPLRTHLMRIADAICRSGTYDEDIRVFRYTWDDEVVTQDILRRNDYTIVTTVTIPPSLSTRRLLTATLGIPQPDGSFLRHPLTVLTGQDVMEARGCVSGSSIYMVNNTVAVGFDAYMVQAMQAATEPMELTLTVLTSNGLMASSYFQGYNEVDTSMGDGKLQEGQLLPMMEEDPHGWGVEDSLWQMSQCSDLLIVGVAASCLRAAGQHQDAAIHYAEFREGLAVFKADRNNRLTYSEHALGLAR